MHPRSLVSTALLLVAVAAGGEEGTIQAVWKPQRATFVYVGHTTFYTCRALEQKIARVLEVIGAHEDIVVDRRDCSEDGAMRLYVEFKSPVEATAQNVQALTTYDAEAELVARVQGVRLPTAEDIPRFPAEWKEVAFVRERRLAMSAADCEFVEQVRRQLLPHLAVRIITDRIFCTPGTIGFAPPRLTVSTLVAAEK